ncbi:hypothetical protein CDQ84_03380 [Clostridium thermosuccinogenes]|uniref:HTH araC/xylS-type domain-containing protein n=2 Tax=Clostridium thermosuccinogenes TaxID=84032 RepID=A0A2K2EYB5_9CLOT|nr:hypothetical protein CDO33_01000 [Pseudoclostridium thermosuccinogenes]PNT91508.1 hypothetical protein CDQ83_17175 [Pseudoclostridium thermosuccinogenes]PNT99134.1 hypothetical protein CDQ85_03380 [Pseudoclostridium thermosuccinogenes]PNU00938.1 hypothetical protein CDQ84_03380 [Pseudoclostridium thermosuccinogenes]
MSVDYANIILSVKIKIAYCNKILEICKNRTKGWIMAESFIFDIPPWPEYLISSYRHFNEGEKHVTRICKDFVLIFMLERELYFTEDNCHIEVKPGQWYMQIPGLKQEGLKGSPAPKYYYIHFKASGQAGPSKESMLQSRIEFKGKPATLSLPIRGNFDPQFFKPMFEQLEHFSKRSPSDILGKQAVFLNILNCLTDTARPNTDHIQSIINQMMEYLAKNYNKPVTCKELSDRFHFTEDYLTRKMKQYAGITPWQYLQHLRIEKAKELLANTDYTLSSIAGSIGYGDLSVFYKAFKKQTGMAPGEWRMKKRGLY